MECGSHSSSVAVGRGGAFGCCGERKGVLISVKLQSRQKFLKKMCKRTQGEVKAAEMERRLDSGEIAQLSIELSVADEDHQRSQVFAGEVLRLGGQ